MTSAVRASGSSRRSLSALATCTSLSQAINSIDNSKPAVILDLGRRLTKVGFAGEYVPRAIIHSQFLDGSIYGQNTNPSGDQQKLGPTLSVMVKFFRSIFNSYLLTMPRERRVVIVESMLTPTRLRDLICEALLEVLNVPSVLFIPSHLAATFPYNTDYALVVDVGYTETVAVPIAEGVTMLSCWEVSNIGARKLEDRVRELLRKHGRIEKWNEVCEIKDEDWNLIEEANIVEDICVRFVFCSPFDRGQAIQAQGAEHGLPPIKSVKLPLGADFLIVPGFVRLAELAEDAKASPSKMKQCESIRFYRFNDQSAEIYLPWLGGSLFGALQDAVQLRSITRETWIEERNIPDWTDYVRHGIPCGRPELER
ncbi:Actin [Ancylostoma caninum]|uniref:Actin n=1 Tax=Ancylostoma caninum TaxID=29170 RepID=A0A368FLB2_ANCCA|nr:Actin [Ancylostoma caninum]